jgi:electron transfer flavoprotein alpha subunit
MATGKVIWVLPEISHNDVEISKLSTGLLSEARYFAEKVGGTAVAILLDDQPRLDYEEILGQYGISLARLFQHSALQYFSAETYSSALLPGIQQEEPWLILMENTIVGKELAPRLAALLETGVISNCAKIELSRPDKPRFFRLVYGDQLYQEVVFEAGKTMLVTMDPRILNTVPVRERCEVNITVIESSLPPDAVRVKHLEFLPADFRTVDVDDADVIVSVGAGGDSDELMPLVAELADLVKGAIGTTRPVVDSGRLPRERLVGQTGKLVSPELYLALGISGSVHHVGGIQGSKKIIAINRDPQAPIFGNSDVGVISDLKDILPLLVERIKHTPKNGTAV